MISMWKLRVCEFLAPFTTFLVGFFLLTFLLWLILAEVYSSILFGIILLLCLSFVWWLISPMVIESCFEVRWVDKESDPLLWNLVEEESKKAEVRVRKVGIVDFESPNVLTYGHMAWLSKMVFSRGLILSLNASEMRTVIAHELGHIKHGDMTIITPLVALLTLYHKIAESYIRSRLERRRSPIHQLVLAAFAYIFFLLTYPQTGLLSRVREEYADEFSVRQTRDPSHLISSLIKVSRGCALRPMDKSRVEGSPLRCLMFIDPTTAISEVEEMEDLLSSRWGIDVERLTAFLGFPRGRTSEEYGFHVFENFRSHPDLSHRLEHIIKVGKESKMPIVVGLTRVG